MLHSRSICFQSSTVAFGQYILDDDGNPVPEPDLLAWAMWMEYSHRSKGKDSRIIQQDRIGGVFVSTVFLGLDQGWPRPSPHPVLWETMIFKGEHDGYCKRYTSREHAEEGHRVAVRLVVDSDLDIKELERLIEVSGGWEVKK